MHLASLDLGQSVAISNRACMAALKLWKVPMRCCGARQAWWRGKRLTLVKASSRRRHLLFDVPVIGPYRNH